MKAINKNIFREIARTKNRFFSIFTICAIGVGFFSGVRATCNDMTLSADDYYDRQALFDLRVMSTFGLTDDDAAAIAEIDGVDQVETSKYTDLAMKTGDLEYLTRVYSIGSGEMNKLEIVEGRSPQNENECIVSVNELKEGLDVGSSVTMVDLTEAEEFPLKYTEYNIVGTFQTPMFISLTQRGSTSIGDGSIDAFMYIAESNFTQEVYTEIYVRSDKLAEMQSYSVEYEQLRDSISEKLEELGVDRSEIRYDEVVGDALTEIADGEAELAQAKIDGEKELADAKAELADAAQQIADGEQELADAKLLLDDGMAQLESAENELADAQKEINDGKTKLAESKTELDTAAAQLADSKAQIDSGTQQLAEAKTTLDATKTQLDRAQAEINTQRAELTSGKTALEQAKTTLAQSQTEYDAGIAQYNAGMAEYEQNMAALTQAEAALEQAEEQYGKDNPTVVQQRVELDAQKQALTQAKATLDATKIRLDSAKAQIDAGAAEIAAKEQQITTGEAQLAAAQAEIDAGYAQYNTGLNEYNTRSAELEAGKVQYATGLAQYEEGLALYQQGVSDLEAAEQQYNDGKTLLEENRTELEQGLTDYNNGIAEIEDAKIKYADGLKEYEDGVETFNTEIADAEQKLADARQELEDAGEAEWYVFSREDNVGYAEYESNAHRIDKIASIFPVFFLLVAALVCLTTMSRMVEEQRTQIGTLKGLGYSNAAVMRHYMVYAVTAAAIGSLLGAFAGMFIFPGVIIYAYSMMYNITEIYFELNVANILLSAGSMIAAIMITVFFSCKKALAETPASLMRPKAPKAGKRVLLERIGFIWNNMSFFGKVSGRNLFRYKRRMFMTVVGIAGCTALSLTGFGVKDSIGDIVNLQYNRIYNYSGYIAIDDELTTEERSRIYDELLEYDPETQYTQALIKQYTVSFEGKNVQCYVTAIEEPAIFEEMVSLHERVSGEKLSLSDGIIVTEKMAALLDAKQGDTAELQLSEGGSHSFTIAGITEHYTSHYMYVTEDMYTELFGDKPAYNMVYFTSGISDNESEKAAFSERMLKTDGVLTVILNSGASSSFSEMMSIMDLVVIVLIISAGALAFVVLYNLTNVNITERIREIATLKVLGFYDKEVSSYVFRENIILSVMGAAVGLLLGTALCQFVVQTAEIDEVMFGREIHPLSFVYSFAVTVVFSLIVNWLMTGVLKKVSMVESLKSVE